eukprot:223736-Heterocapsa_arctica.AAC.1
MIDVMTETTPLESRAGDVDDPGPGPQASPPASLQGPGGHPVAAPHRVGDCCHWRITLMSSCSPTM